MDSNDDKKWLDALDKVLGASGKIIKAMFRQLSESEGLLGIFIRKLLGLSKFELAQLSIGRFVTANIGLAIATLEQWLSSAGAIVKDGIKSAIELSIKANDMATKAFNELLVLGYTVSDIIKIFTNKTRDLIMAQVRIAARSNTIQDLNKYFFGTKQKGGKDGLISRIKRSFIYHVSNTTAAAFNWGNELAWSLQGVKRVRLIATLDDKTSNFCEHIHNATYPIFQGLRPPFHPHCRTIVVPA